MVTTERPMACAMCLARLVVKSSTTAHPEAPEMFSVPPGASIGLVTGDVHPEMVIVCSDDCLRALLRE